MPATGRAAGSGKQGAVSHYASRRAHTDAQLARTVSDILDRVGYAGLTIERVAQESGVAKTTIYRRWGSKAEMVFDLVIHGSSQNEEPSAVSQKDSRAAIRQLVERAVTMIASPTGLSVIPGLLAGMAENEELMASMRTVVDEAQKTISSALGETASHSVDINELQATLLGVPYVRIHLLQESDTNQVIEQLTAHLLLLTGLESS